MIDSGGNKKAELLKALAISTLEFEQGNIESCMNRLEATGLLDRASEIEDPAVYEAFLLYAQACTHGRKAEELLKMLNILERSHVSCQETFKHYFDEAA